MDVKMHETAKNLEQLIDLIRRFKQNDICWFRGQNKAEYGLAPGALRFGEMYQWKDNFGRLYPPKTVLSYSTRGDAVFHFRFPYLFKFIELLEKNDEVNPYAGYSLLDYECLGQHYGLKTGLLDWSTDATVALFFACYGNIDNDSAFFVLKPELWNEKIVGQKKIFATEEIPDYGPDDIFMSPIAIRTDKKFPRVTRQSGYFTVHGEMIWSLDYYEFTSLLLKIIIPTELKKQIITSLDILGINRNSVYINPNDDLDLISAKATELMEPIKKEEIEKKLIAWKNADPNWRNN